MSSFLTQNSSSLQSSVPDSQECGSFLTNRMTGQSDDTPVQQGPREQYRKYVQRKRLKKPQTQSHNQLSIFKTVIYASLIAFSIFVAYLIQTKNPTKHKQTSEKQYSHAFPNPRAQPIPKTQGICNSYLPYSISSQKQLETLYNLWFGKVGSNIYGTSYQPGHFIERHVASNGKCTYAQYTDGKTVFYDWSQVTKAFKQTSIHKCHLLDLTTFNYDFEIRIPAPSQYIKGIDCRTGTVKMFPKIFILYRKAIRNPNPDHHQYLASNYLTIWTFYPKN